MQEPGRKALFVIAKHWRPHKCPQPERGIFSDLDILCSTVWH